MKILLNYIYLCSIIVLLFLVALKPVRQEPSGLKNNTSAEINNNAAIHSNLPQIQPVNFTTNKEELPAKVRLSCCKIPSGKNRFANFSQ